MYFNLFLLSNALMGGEGITEDHWLRCQRELYSENIRGMLRRVYTVPQGGYLYYKSDLNCKLYEGLNSRDRKGLEDLAGIDHLLVQFGSRSTAKPSELYVEGLAISNGRSGDRQTLTHIGQIELRSFCYDFRNQTYVPTVKEISDFVDLKYLDLYFASMTRENFAELSGLSNLTYLGLPYTSNDDYLSVVANFKNLRYLNASWTKITGSGWCDIADMSELQILDLRGNYFRDYNIAELNPLHLKKLLLSYTNITDRDLYFYREPDLEYLELHSTAISDKGLSFLAYMKNLKYLTVFNTQVTLTGIEALRQKLPGLTIVTEWDRNSESEFRERSFELLKKQRLEIDIKTETDSALKNNGPKYKLITWDQQPLYQYVIEWDTEVGYPIIFEDNNGNR